MAAIYLFDWGDTLMLDIAGAQGKMCDWPEVTSVDGAYTTLKALSERAEIYIATGAADSQPQDIRKALARVGLDSFISSVFCQANLGVGKDSAEFFPRIIQQLETNPIDITMVGDSLYRDVMPALLCGLKAIWFNPQALPVPDNTMAINQLEDLLTCAV